MTSATEPPVPTPGSTTADRVAKAVLFAVLVILMVTMPKYPSTDLDSSWRMALGYFFQHGLQFGRDVVFTYGPLGFLMGNTYSGLQFNSLVVWQIFHAIVFSVFIFRLGSRLSGYSRLFFFIYFFAVGFSYEDALEQMVIAMAGFELIRYGDRDRRWPPAVLGLFLSLLALLKFTNLILSTVFVLAAAGRELWLRRPAAAARTAAWYFGSFLVGWILCRQNPLNLPVYLANSWVVSEGYQQAMGLPAPPEALWIGLAVLGLLITYAVLRLVVQPDRSRTLATTVGLAAYVYLNWKHGFVRADGHMVGFFYCSLLVVTGFPALLDDGPRWRVGERLILAIAGVLAVMGTYTALPWVVRGLLSNPQEKFHGNIEAVLDWHQFRQTYDRRLEIDKIGSDLAETRKVVGRATVDVLGHEQGVALYNGFNYDPRPVFQGYSVYTPRLSRLNFDFYASDRAPEYVLVKMESIDGRFSTFDDSEVLQLLAQRYEYVLNEKGFHLWHRKPGPFDAAAIAPQLLRRTVAPVGQPVVASDLADRPLWAVVDLQPSLLGRLRSFFYKPPIIRLRIVDSNGGSGDYRMPLPQGRTGFIINPIVEDLISYMRFAGAKPERRIRSLAVEVAANDRDCYADQAEISFYALKPSTAGLEFFRQENRLRFNMFKTAPVSFEAHAPPSSETLDGRRVMVLHAPSEMAFDVPPGAREVSGSFGFLPGAWSNGGRTDGAEFIVACAIQGTQRILYQRMLDPVNDAADRGLQDFRVRLPEGTIGRLFLRISPGPDNNFAWDWTAWTDIEIK